MVPLHHVLPVGLLLVKSRLEWTQYSVLSTFIVSWTTNGTRG